MSRTTFKLLALCVVGAIVAASLLGQSGNAANVSTFTGGDVGEGLDLDGTFLYAVDGGAGNAEDPPKVIRDATFLIDVDFDPFSFPHPGVTSGYFGIGSAPDSPWGIVPDFGASANDTTLETIMSDISVGVAPRRHDVTMQVVPGQQYKMQILLSENFWGHVAGFENGQREQDLLLFSGDFNTALDGNTFDPVALGRTIYDSASNVNVRAAVAGLPDPLNAGVVVTMEFTAVDPLLTLWATPPATPSGVEDTVSIINAFTVEVVPEPSSLALVALGAAMTIVRRRRRAKA
jgi:hypothetical protein